MSGLTEVRGFWDRVAADWDIQVGRDGDKNRILNSDPVLWALAGEVAGKGVLDAGCGTGYLTEQLGKRGARVIGVDFSEKMIEVARARAPGLDFRVDSCSDLATVGSGTIDLVVSNYVLMDTPELEEALRAFHRVLAPGGAAVVVFSHPCFPAGRSRMEGGDRLVYWWDFPYFERTTCVDPPWAHFSEEFIFFHRPLSDYWKAFVAAGFAVTAFEEPRISPDRFDLADRKTVEKSLRRPFSVAFRLGKSLAADD